MNPAELRIAAEIFHQDSKTRARLLTFADLVEATKAHLKAYNYSESQGTRARLNETLTRVEALKP